MAHQELRNTLDEGVKSIVKEFAKESQENFNEYGQVQDWSKILSNLGKNGTDIQKNAADPMGDGDQSLIFDRNQAQLHRDVWSAGADVQHLLMNNGLPPFIIGCMVGNLDMCTKLLSDCDTTEKKKALLETRYSVLRLSPLFFTAIGFATMGFLHATGKKQNLEVAQLLLEHGARPDARDLCGKTIIHYCAGPLCAPGSTTLLDIADLCIARAAELNQPPLVDARDRFGGVALQQPVMLNRVDLVAFLCTKHSADATIRDNDNMCAEKMADFSIDIRAIINKSRNKSSYKAFKSQCLNCLATDIPTSKCKRCLVATYCSRECQVQHWKVHKKVCTDVALEEPGIIITVDPAPKKNVTYLASGASMTSWDGKVPPGMKCNEFFDIKIQVGTVAEMPFLLYNKERNIELSVSSKNCKKYTQLFDAIHNFEPCQGRKAYMRALITDKGELSVNIDPLFVRKW
eukprot:gene13920-16007_t